MLGEPPTGPERLCVLFYPREAFDDVGEAFLQMVAVGRHGDGLGHGFFLADGGKTEVRSAASRGISIRLSFSSFMAIENLLRLL